MAIFAKKGIFHPCTVSKSEAALDMLRRRFDERLASLQAADAGERLRSLMRGPAKLGGKIKAGESH